MKLTDDVLAELSGLTVTGNRVTMPQMDRALYVRVNKALVAMGGRWDRKAAAHVFDTADPTDRIDAAIVAGEVTTAGDLGYFPTPGPLAAELVKQAHIEPGMSVLEPSAGTGAIAFAARAAGGIVTCCEMDDGRAAKLREAGFTVSHEGDFLQCAEPGLHGGYYDRVVMNPPFSKGQDIAHVKYALSFMRPGARLVAVMSAGITFRSDKRTADFRALVDLMGGLIAPLPDDSFKASGTRVRTVVVELSVPL